jgi:hypothetical protein
MAYAMTHRVYKVVGRHRYAYEYESYWDPKRRRTHQRMVRYLGPCDRKGRILSAPKTRLESVHSAFPVGPLAVFFSAAQQLRARDHIREVLAIDDQAAGTLLALGLNQAAARVPIYHLPDWVRASPLPKWLSLDAEQLTARSFEDALSSLCHLTPEKTWEDRGLLLQQELTRAWRNGSREPAGAYYDITKQAYYGTHCPYGQLGHDERGTAPVVGFGMVVSKEHHHPILCRSLPGGQTDVLSVAPTLELLQAQGLRHLTVVMDKGMNSETNVRQAVDAGYHVVGSVKGWSREAVAYASRWPGEGLEHAEHVVGTSHGGAVYARAFTAPLMRFPRMRIAVVENLSRKAEDRQARDLLLQELEGPVSRARLKEIRQELGDVIVPSAGRRGFHVDPTAVERERVLDGRFLLFSTDLSLDGQQMYRTYFAKDAVEKAFRTSKGELSLGPVRYRRKDRLDAYATVVYVAYLLWSWAERRLQEKYPERHLSEALRALESVSWVRFGATKSVREWCTRLTNEQKELLTALGATEFLPAT